MKRQRGQVALIVLIISAISLTIGLSISERIRTGVRISKDDEMLQRAFNVAESGIEDYLARGRTQYSTQDATANVSSIGVTGQVVDFGEYVGKDGYAFFWLAGHNGDSIDYTNHYQSNNLSICYNSFSPGGLLVYYFYRSGASYGVTRSAYNLSSDYFGGEESTRIAGTSCTGYSNTIGHSLSPNPTSVTPILLVIRPIGPSAGSRFAVSGSNFPSQGDLISSTGSSGQTNTIVKVMKRWDPSMYMFFMLEGIVSRSSVN